MLLLLLLVCILGLFLILGRSKEPWVITLKKLNPELLAKEKESGE